jgi:hypothetical protein
MKKINKNKPKYFEFFSKIKQKIKAFTLADVMIVLGIISVISIGIIQLAKTSTTFANKIMYYTAFNNLKTSMSFLTTQGWDTDGDGTVDIKNELPSFGHATDTAICLEIEISPISGYDHLEYYESSSTGSFTITGIQGSGTVELTATAEPSGGEINIDPALLSFEIKKDDVKTINFTVVAPEGTDFEYTITATIEGGNAKTYTFTQTREPDPCPGAHPDTAAGGLGLCVYKDDTGAPTDWSTANSNCTAVGKRLPNLNELRSIYDNRIRIGSFSTGYYWSSEEETTGEYGTAYYFNFGSGSPGPSNKYNPWAVRCVNTL